LYNIIIFNQFNQFFRINYNFFKLLKYTFRFNRLLKILKVKLLFLLDYYKSFFFFYFIKKTNIPTVSLVSDEIKLDFFSYNICVFKNNIIFKLIYVYMLYDIYLLAGFKKQAQLLIFYLKNFRKLL
jgi:hypothetical protein